MKLTPTLAAAIATAAVGVPKAIATGSLFAAAPDVASTVLPLVGADWAWLKDAGTIGVLIWMVVWFQKRLEAKDLAVQQLTTDLIKAVDKLADSQSAVAKAIAELRPK